ncbi:Cytoplasmic tRNA 2-thiolation protein 1 [Thelohanellus kitauei]|uniref:Cytoplasmic tRNA 2-thiolation protein 1 n=1 Tax=Thelohanellus kitauei TaxID=669202 RepID=A0A0C2N6L1_THEKT|nr:Cytoplasmic tRNA 2-thiolation protein 1 [Thelohanellus kitauei]
MNLLRGDVNRLPKCVLPITMDCNSLPRCKPLIYSYQKEIVLYAKYLELDYFATECTYSHYGFRTDAKTFIKDLESVKPTSTLNIIKSIECLECKPDTKKQTLLDGNFLFTHIHKFSMVCVPPAGSLGFMNLRGCLPNIREGVLGFPAIRYYCCSRYNFCFAL